MNEGVGGKFRYAVNDVVTTIEAVTIYNSRGKADGKALPGWKWRIVEIGRREKGIGVVVVYKVVAHTAPDSYHQTLTDKQIAGKVGVNREG